jgi:hypothetical protein
MIGSPEAGAIRSWHRECVAPGSRASAHMVQAT